MPMEPRFLRLADKFLAFVQRETGLGLIVCDETGTIVRSTNRTRIGHRHAGAQRIMRREVDEYAVTAEEAASNPGIKEGVNYPITVDGKRVGTFGIAGPLAITRPLTKVSAVVLASWLKEMKQEQFLHEAADRVFMGVDQLARRVEENTAFAEQISQAMTQAVVEAAEKVNLAEAVVDTVQGIAQQSHILSINGSIEATRAGEHGRTFAVLARDMTELAQETKGASGAIKTTLSEIAQGISLVQKAIARSAATAAEQASTLQEVTKTVAGLKDAMANLENSFGTDMGSEAASKKSRLAAAARS